MAAEEPVGSLAPGSLDVHTPINAGDAEPVEGAASGRCFIVFFSNAQAGVVIGKRGGTISTVSAEYDVFIRVFPQRDAFGMSLRPAMIVGQPDAVRDAYLNLVERIDEDALNRKLKKLGMTEEVDATTVEPSDVTVLISVSEHAVGQIIGKRGSTVKGIRDASGAQIHLSAKGTAPRGSRERLLRVRGNLSQCCDAATRLWPHIVSTPPAADNDSLIAFWGGKPPRRASAGASHLGHPGAHRAMGSMGAHPAVSPPGAGWQAPGMQAIVQYHLSVPSAYVGAIIGKGGMKILEMQRLSRARITISPRVAGSANDERSVTISGQPRAVQAARLMIEQYVLDASHAQSRGAPSMHVGPVSVGAPGMMHHTLPYSVPMVGPGGMPMTPPSHMPSGYGYHPQMGAPVPITAVPQSSHALHGATTTATTVSDVPAAPAPHW